MEGGSHTGHQGELTRVYIHNRLFRVCYLSSTFVIFPSAPRDVMGLNQANKAHGETKINETETNERIPVREKCEKTFNNVAHWG